MWSYELQFSCFKLLNPKLGLFSRNKKKKKSHANLGVLCKTERKYYFIVLEGNAVHQLVWLFKWIG